jgi:hypothetical protein
LRIQILQVSSGGEAWRSLTAVGQAMGTQPRPTPAGWYIALLPSWLLKILAGAIIVVEVPISFLVLSPLRGIRHAAAASHLCVQAFVAISGGYGFYPILASVLGMFNFQTLVARFSESWFLLLLLVSLTFVLIPGQLFPPPLSRQLCHASMTQLGLGFSASTMQGTRVRGRQSH